MSTTTPAPEFVPAAVGELVILTTREAAYIGTAGHVDPSGRVLTVDVPGRFGMVMVDQVGPDARVQVAKGSDAQRAALAAAVRERAGGGTFPHRLALVTFVKAAVATA